MTKLMQYEVQLPWRPRREWDYWSSDLRTLKTDIANELAPRGADVSWTEAVKGEHHGQFRLPDGTVRQFTVTQLGVQATPPSDAVEIGGGDRTVAKIVKTKRPKRVDTNCLLCGEKLRPNQEQAEMHDPEMCPAYETYEHAYSDGYAGVVHGQCGINAGWEMS